MLLYHCSDPRNRESIQREGLRGLEGEARFAGQVHAWPALEAAQKHRDDSPGDWDIWMFDDHERSVEATRGPRSARATARVIHGAVPLEDLVLIEPAPGSPR